MDIETIVQQNFHLQKQSFENFFNTLNLFQTNAEWTCCYWYYKMGINKDLQTVVNQYWTALKQGRDHARSLTNKGFTNIETYLIQFRGRLLESSSF